MSNIVMMNDQLIGDEFELQKQWSRQAETERGLLPNLLSYLRDQERFDLI